jgi:hypothetical protein
MSSTVASKSLDMEYYKGAPCIILSFFSNKREPPFGSFGVGVIL